MSNARARANHQIYLARILLASWREACDRQEIAAVTLAQAFHRGVCDHLADAYGWFLLEITGCDVLPLAPPHSCGALPAVAQGQAVAGEIREFEQLESGGWLADMLALRDIDSVARRQHNNLAATASALPAPDEVEQWQRQLQALFERMRDSLDEY